MTPYDKLIVGDEGLTLGEANDIIWDKKLNQLPIVDKDRRLKAFVFRKDYEQHKENPNEVLMSTNATSLVQASTPATTRTAFLLL